VVQILHADKSAASTTGGSPPNHGKAVVKRSACLRVVPGTMQEGKQRRDFSISCLTVGGAGV
jgi:hypothetical protein